MIATGMALDRLAIAVCEGLSKPQKELSPEFLYDDVGSALFEAITYLPEYPLTRADARLLSLHAEQLSRRFRGTVVVAELGSGSGRKVRPVLEALQPVAYYPIDLSSAALDACASGLGDLATVHPVLATHLDGLDRVRDEIGSEPLVILFLGSSIGNFDPAGAAEFLAGVRARMQPGDGLLLGTDLVKDEDALIRAYDDPAGVTAAFNRNMLGHINRMLGADFDLACFDHEARYYDHPPRVEMHLRATRQMRVTIPERGFSCALDEGETILTERSHKYRVEMIDALAGDAGFRVVEQWIDREWPFAESLLIPA